MGKRAYAVIGAHYGDEGKGHVLACKVDEVPETVSKIVVGCSSSVSSPAEGATKVDENGMIDW